MLFAISEVLCNFPFQVSVDFFKVDFGLIDERAFVRFLEVVLSKWPDAMPRRKRHMVGELYQ